jgi:hypothetical protein
MWRIGVNSIWLVTCLLALWGCAGSMPDFVSRPEPWRDDEARQCLAAGYVRPTPFLVQRAALGGPGYCGAAQPFEMSAALNGQVTMKPSALLTCPMIPAVDRWVGSVVAPAASRHFGQPVVELKVAASYGCRPMNNVSGARLSEHGHANAIDISAFQLADGRWIKVKSGWSGDQREQAFLHQVHDGACQIFTTVLGPNYDPNHRDHFHLDLARHGLNGLKSICR